MRLTLDEFRPLRLDLLVALLDHEVHLALVVLGLQRLEVDFDAPFEEVGRPHDVVLVVDRVADPLLHNLAQVRLERLLSLDHRRLPVELVESLLELVCIARRAMASASAGRRNPLYCLT